jgi:arylsulfatase A-like enzyme
MPRPSPQSDRPNFVFIYTDDQRWDALSVVQREMGDKARFPWFTTPNLDRLAAEGMRFRNAFVVSSLCAPSRAAFLTGRYNHENGVANNHTPFPASNITHATLLRAAGYTTGYIGKWHMGSQRERPGFDFAASYIGQGRYNNCPFVVNGKDTPTKGWIDDVSTDFAIAFLKENKGKPFSLVVGFKSSHGPWEPPERAKERFKNELSRPAPNLSGAPAIYRNAPNTPRPNQPVTPERAEMQRNYFRTLSAVDDNIGRILAALDELGLTENTVVVYTSDNGYYLGEHGLGDKRSAYDESLRIPMLVRYPKRVPKGQTEDAMVLNVDVAPTFLDLAGLPVPAAMQGRSLKPFLQGTGARSRDAFFYSYFYERGYPTTPTTLAVRAPDAKLIKYPGHDEWTELFDLKADPYETKNLWNVASARSLRDRMTATYDREAKAVNFRIPDYADKPESEVTPPTGRGPRDKEVLRFEATPTTTAERIEDRSGMGNSGTVNGIAIAPGRNGKPAFRFDGKGYIEVANKPSLNPSGGAWTVEVTFRPEKPDGVVLARGGQSQGYALYLDDGYLCFAVTVEGGPTIARGPRLPMNEWFTVRAAITKDRRIRLRVDGKEVAAVPLPAFIARDPNDRMQIGTDLATTVVMYPKPERFVGLIESVRLFSGEES